MAYARGELYLFADVEERVHLWVADGTDFWEESGWATTPDGARRQDGYERAGGVSVPESVLDEYVVMRVAELVAAGTAEETIARAVRHRGGNDGCYALERLQGRLSESLDSVARAFREADRGGSTAE